MGPGIHVDPTQDARDRRGDRRRGGAVPAIGQVKQPVARDSRQPLGGGRPAEAGRGWTEDRLCSCPPGRRARFVPGGDSMLKERRNAWSQSCRAAARVRHADRRGLPRADDAEIDGVRPEVLKHGARFTVVKNTLTKRAAEEAGVPALVELLDGPTAIAFVRRRRHGRRREGAQRHRPRDEDPEPARRHPAGQADERRAGRDLASLPPAEVLRGQVLGAIVAPLSAIAASSTRRSRTSSG